MQAAQAIIIIIIIIIIIVASTIRSREDPVRIADTFSGVLKRVRHSFFRLY